MVFRMLWNDGSAPTGLRSLSERVLRFKDY
jgi:hypothetical protein